MAEVTAPKAVRASIEFTEEEWDEFVDGETGFKIVSDEMIDHRRWSLVHEVIVHRLEDDTYWRGIYEVGATENQWYNWHDRWGGDKARLVEVFKREKTVIVYE